MAQVAQDPELRARIERFLDYAWDEWTSVPEYAAEFPTWDETQQLGFVHEWSIRESALEVLRDYATRDMLTPEQQDRYTRVLALAASYRGLMNSLLAD